MSETLFTVPATPRHADPFARAMARSTDPQTSHDAAASVTDLRPRQAAVLDTLRRIGGGTDEQIAAAYTGPSQSPSGLRTRRCELVDLGLVVDSGRRGVTASGRSTVVWTVKP